MNSKVIVNMNNEGNVKTLVESARVNLEAGNKQQALQEATRAVSADSSHPPALFLLGVALRLTGSLDEAIRRLSEFLLLAPNVAQGRYELALAWYSSGQISAAVAELQKAVEIDPGFAAAWRTLSEGLLVQGDEGAARRDEELCAVPRQGWVHRQHVPGGAHPPRLLPRPDPKFCVQGGPCGADGELPRQGESQAEVPPRFLRQRYAPRQHW